MDYFLDPVLRGPVIGSMFMCLGAAIIGVIVFLRKESLLGEALSHATYPGIALGAILLGSGDGSILIGAFLSALLGLFVIWVLEKRFHIHSDAALCFALASFFGVGVTIASRLQFSHSEVYRNIQVYLYGQAATMDDTHIVWYGLLSLLVIAITTLFFKEIKVITFDSSYAKTLGISVKKINLLFFVLVVFSIVIGIRSVGVVLMSAMLIAPAVAARQWTNHMGRVILYAALFGIASGFLGNVLSYESSHEGFSLPTGPMIVIVAVFFSLISLLFAPQKGWIIRLFQQFRFERECLRENLLKEVWRAKKLDISTLAKYQSTSQRVTQNQVRSLIRQGFMDHDSSGNIVLTDIGTSRAAHIVRLHRLWELYLVDTLGIGAEKVHRSAEEMEHILTPDLEKRLEEQLKHPKYDPHHKPIPEEPHL